MSAIDLHTCTTVEHTASELLTPLLQRTDAGPTRQEAAVYGACTGVVIGELLALVEDGAVPLVRFPGQPDAAAIAARSTVDLQGSQIGHDVVLMFEQANLARPIVMGVLRARSGSPGAERPAQIDVDIDGQRLVISADKQLVLRCGAASITLMHSGKVVINGNYLLSSSSGVNRIKGASIQLN